MSSEEAGIRIIEPDPEEVWAPKAGTPVISLLEEDAMMISQVPPEFMVNINEKKCVRCKRCTTECGFSALTYSKEFDCITGGRLQVRGLPALRRPFARSTPSASRTTLWFTSITIISPTIIRKNILKQAETGGILLTAMGCDKPYPILWDHILIDACQVTNPSIDPLREPMELRTYLGKKPDRLEFDVRSTATSELKTDAGP